MEALKSLISLLLPLVSWLIPLLVLWVLPWKGIALWRAAGNKHLWWFVALLLFNTLAILEIVYIFGFSRKKILEE